MKWIGHTLRNPDGAIGIDALQWNPQGDRKIGRPVEMWRRSVNKELGRVGKVGMNPEKLRRRGRN